MVYRTKILKVTAIVAADLDDGINDLVAGAPEDDNGGTNRDAIWVSSLIFLNSDTMVQQLEIV